jgi:hypothetical protein
MNSRAWPQGRMPAMAPDVRLDTPGDIDTLLSSWPRLLLLTSVTIGAHLLPERERRAHEARLGAHLSGCRCLESGLGMIAGAGTYAAALALYPALRMSSLWTEVLVGFGAALVAGAVGRIAGHVAARRRVQRELRALQGAVASQPGSAERAPHADRSPRRGRS